MRVQRKFRSDSVRVAGIFNVEMIPYFAPMSHGTRGRLAWVRWGLGLGVGLAGYQFLFAGKYIALLIEHEWAALSTQLMNALSL